MWGEEFVMHRFQFLYVYFKYCSKYVATVMTKRSVDGILFTALLQTGARSAIDATQFHIANIC